MARNNTTSAFVDAILRALAVAGALSAVALAPNMAIALDKPMRVVFKKLDKRAQEREINRLVAYMRRNKLIAENYEFGLEITAINLSPNHSSKQPFASVCRSRALCYPGAVFGADFGLCAPVLGSSGIRLPVPQ